MSETEIEQMDLKRKRSDDDELGENKRAKLEEKFDQKKYEDFLSRVQEKDNTKVLEFINEVGCRYLETCRTCNQERFLYDFGQRQKCQNGLELWKCLICKHQSRREILSRLLNDMKKHTKDRNDKGRNHAPLYYNSIDQLEVLLNQQNDRCFYSNEKMKLHSEVLHDSQQISIERLDDNLGYVKGNCVFVCLKYNFLDKNKLTAEQKKKYVQAMMNPVELKDYIPTLTKKDFEKSKRTQKKREVRETKVVDGIQLQKCSLCREFLEFDRFRKMRNTIHTQCKKCQNQFNKTNQNNPRGVIIQKVKDARHHANERAKKHNGDDECCKVDEDLFDLVIERLFEQNLCCAVTKLPFVFELGSPETPSIKRIDNTKGYVKGNICLVFAITNNSAVDG